MQVSLRFALLVFWLCLSSFIFGFHISALNTPQKVIVCGSSPLSSTLAPHLPSPPSYLPTCLDITVSQFGFITAAFTLGGLVGVLLAPSILPRFSIKRSLVLCALVSVIGGLVQTVSVGLWTMLLGRVISGMGGAMAVSVVPPALSLVAPEKIRGSIGVLHQLSIVTAILMAQLAGLYLSTPTAWRYIPLLSAVVAGFQLCLAPLVPSPDGSHIALAGSPAVSPAAIREDPEASEGLLSPEARDGEAALRRAAAEDESIGGTTNGGQKSMGVWEMLRAKEIRRGVLCCLGAMLLQQFSGINAVLYFSVSILTPLMPTNAPLVAFYVTVFNLVMTFPAIYLVERMGRKSLMLWSVAGMAVATVCLAWGLNGGLNGLSAFGVFGFVGAFAIGLGPVPWVIISDLVPAPARASLASLSLAINFLSNLFIGAFFLPIRLALSRPSPTPSNPDRREGDGTVFYLFAGCLVVGGVALARGWR